MSSVTRKNKIQPLTPSERTRLQKQFPGVFMVLVAAESVAHRSRAREASILRNDKRSDYEKFVDSETRAVDRVTRMVEIALQGEG